MTDDRHIMEPVPLGGCEIIDVDFKPKDADLDTGLVVKRRYEGCSHEHGQRIDEALRTVQCKKCDAPLDAVEVLLYWARHWERLASSTRHLREETGRRHKEIEALRRERSNVKAAHKRAVESAVAGGVVAKDVILEELRSVLETADCWLREHGAAYVRDEGGVNEPGLAELLLLIKQALARSA